MKLKREPIKPKPTIRKLIQRMVRSKTLGGKSITIQDPKKGDVEKIYMWVMEMLEKKIGDEK
jgi:hypothetical protein